MFLFISIVSKLLAAFVWLCEVVLVPIIVYLSVCLTKRLGVVHRALIATFSITCFVLSTLQTLLGPFYHSVQGGLVVFVTNKWINGWLSSKVITFLAAAYSGTIVTLISFFPVLFAIRYWTMRSRYWVFFFTGRKGAILVGYTIVFGAFVTGLILKYGQLDVETMEHFRDELENHYDHFVDEIWGYGIVAYKYNVSGSFSQCVRWESLSIAGPVTFISTGQFVVTMVSAFKMFWEIHDLLALLSSSTRKTRRQFTKCLLFQIIPPTLCLFIPITIVHVLPYSNWNMDLTTGISIFLAIYPLVDSIILLYILSEYREATKKLLRKWIAFVCASKQKQAHSSRPGVVRKFRRLDFV